MWVNFSKNVSKKDDQLKGPHDSDRCEACRRGECDRTRF
jgi:hypothetical protein